ncbi:hypothetical protein RJ639_014860 [Escallonia herrerae]|uniref:Uncharacterized protein n=1 Tax=Escallonia herrerae TaxID=1293975 RepID=A0AA88VKK3_9ASTE|nr:hypothetical protein RJ639_014860 [Escallonia herrerae]
MDRSTNNNYNGQNRDGLLLKTAQHHQSETGSPATTSSPDFVLQWGNRKRLRCMKVQIKDNAAKKFSSSNVPAGPAPVHRATVRIDRRVVRSDHKDPAPSAAAVVSNGNGYPNLRQRQSSPAPPRILRNTENSIGMKGHSNGVKGLCSPDRGGGGHDKKVGAISVKNWKMNNYARRLEGLLVSPGSWLCDLTLERYEVREKKISKKRPRGLKAMGNMESDSE